MLSRFTEWTKHQPWMGKAVSAGCEPIVDAGKLLTCLVYPPVCAFCYEAVNMDCRLCPACMHQLISTQTCCQRCSMPIPPVLPNDDCIHCRKAGWRFSRVVALGPYRGKLREAVILCKKMKSDNLRQALSEQLVYRIRQRLPIIDQQQPILLPVPNHWSRAFSKMAPTAFRLASMISRQTGWPVSTRIVRRIRRTEKQGMLSIHERRQNVRGAFQKASTQSLSGRHVLIVDDVLTSGATANEMTRQVLRGNPADISIVVVARAAGS